MSEDVRFMVFEDNIDIEDIIIDKKLRLDGKKFDYGYASIRQNGEVKCYFAVKLYKKRLKSLEKEVLYSLMGSPPFILQYDEEAILFLRTKFESSVLKKKNEISILKILKKK